jgi:hypothetical protein
MIARDASRGPEDPRPRRALVREREALAMQRDEDLLHEIVEIRRTDAVPREDAAREAGEEPIGRGGGKRGQSWQA